MSTPQEELLLVDRLADHMRMKLFANRDRPHWHQSDIEFLYGRLIEECEELLWAAFEGKGVWEEAADVANFAAMIADKEVKV